MRVALLRPRQSTSTATVSTAISQFLVCGTCPGIHPPHVRATIDLPVYGTDARLEHSTSRGPNPCAGSHFRCAHPGTPRTGTTP